MNLIQVLSFGLWKQPISERTYECMVAFIICLFILMFVKGFLMTIVDRDNSKQIKGGWLLIWMIFRILQSFLYVFYISFLLIFNMMWVFVVGNIIFIIYLIILACYTGDDGQFSYPMNTSLQKYADNKIKYFSKLSILKDVKKSINKSIVNYGKKSVIK